MSPVNGSFNKRKENILSASLIGHFDLCHMQVNLVDWLKMMVASRRSEEVVDPTIETRPSTRALKRALLTALRCVDPDSEKRPKMGQVVRMLESDDPIPRGVCITVLQEIRTLSLFS